MDAQKVDLFMMTNSKMFLPQHVQSVRDKLAGLDDSKMAAVQAMDFKDPTTMLLFSLFLGSLGVDRFMLGDTGMGILKLLTAGLCGILSIVDWFTITNKTKTFNYNLIMTMI